MEYIFLIIAILITLSSVYGIGRMVYTHKKLIKVYKESEFLLLMHILLGLLLGSMIFMTLAACNNTFWHLPYLMN